MGQTPAGFAPGLSGLRSDVGLTALEAGGGLSATLPSLSPSPPACLPADRSLENLAGRPRLDSLSSVEEDDYDTLADIDSDKNVIRTKVRERVCVEAACSAPRSSCTPLPPPRMGPADPSHRGAAVGSRAAFVGKLPSVGWQWLRTQLQFGKSRTRGCQGAGEGAGAGGRLLERTTCHFSGLPDPPTPTLTPQVFCSMGPFCCVALRMGHRKD